MEGLKLGRRLLTNFARWQRDDDAVQSLLHQQTAVDVLLYHFGIGDFLVRIHGGGFEAPLASVKDLKELFVSALETFLSLSLLHIRPLR